MRLHGQQRLSFPGSQSPLSLGFTVNPDGTLLETLGTLTLPVITLPDKRFLTLLFLLRHNAPKLQMKGNNCPQRPATQAWAGEVFLMMVSLII
ncbi:hypothetical protein CCL09_10085 [Pseudomonas congelans]|nr:hypothetical protein [Pseudomonas congelans]PBQ00918.1 hypothetical protein CCL24_00445 [Pseudomonas congelans]PBQ05513.1 hypothetical protein CCL17_04465 [Pseudomonas congelans]PBQ07592.1 hypothetical protein CCL07_09325 [Pseudomonas congelans]PBQ18250.1 hypothetical protein CCL09_10085 [Pseudomonas congelans]